MHESLFTIRHRGRHVCEPLVAADNLIRVGPFSWSPATFVCYCVTHPMAEASLGLLQTRCPLIPVRAKGARAVFETGLL